MDRNSCDNLLNAILTEKKEEDFKKNVIQTTRLQDRNKMMKRHNDRIHLAERIGIKVKSNLNGQVNLGAVQPSIGNTSFNGGFSEIQHNLLNSKMEGTTPNNNNGNNQQMFSQFDSKMTGQTARSTNTQAAAVGAETAHERVSMLTSFVSPRTYQASERTEMLAMPKPQYHGKDFFQRSEFRGLFLADHQEAIGERAFKCVDSLNQDTVSQFNSIGSFKDSIS